MLEIVRVDSSEVLVKYLDGAEWDFIIVGSTESLLYWALESQRRTALHPNWEEGRLPQLQLRRFQGSE